MPADGGSQASVDRGTNEADRSAQGLQDDLRSELTDNAQLIHAKFLVEPTGSDSVGGPAVNTAKGVALVQGITDAKSPLIALSDGFKARINKGLSLALMRGTRATTQDQNFAIPVNADGSLMDGLMQRDARGSLHVSQNIIDDLTAKFGAKRAKDLLNGANAQLSQPKSGLVGSEDYTPLAQREAAFKAGTLNLTGFGDNKAAASDAIRKHETLIRRVTNSGSTTKPSKASIAPVKANTPTTTADGTATKQSLVDSLKQAKLQAEGATRRQAEAAAAKRMAVPAPVAAAKAAAHSAQAAPRVADGDRIAAPDWLGGGLAILVVAGLAGAAALRRRSNAIDLKVLNNIEASKQKAESAAQHRNEANKDCKATDHTGKDYHKVLEDFGKNLTHVIQRVKTKLRQAVAWVRTHSSQPEPAMETAAQRPSDQQPQSFLQRLAN